MEELRSNTEYFTRHAMLEEICMDISRWRKLCYQVVLVIDLNENISSDTMTDIFSSVVLTKAIAPHHCATHMMLMYQIETHPIYGIYTSITLQVSSGGSLPFLIIPFDHHLLWLKNKFDSVFGAKMDTLVPHTAQELNYQKPDTVKRFIEL